MSNSLIVDAVKGTLRPLRESVERDENTQDKVREWLDVCETTVPMIQRIAVYTHRCLLGGIEGSKLAFLLKEAKDALEMARPLFEKVQESATNDAQLFEGKESGLATVAKGIDSIKTSVGEINRLLTWLETSRPRLSEFSPPVEPRPEDYRKLDDALLTELTS